MDPAWLLLLLPLAVASGWVGARRRFSSPRVINHPTSGKPYLETLNLVINDQHDKALDVLSTALQEHDQDLEIQLALGSLFRRRGEIERATQIHQRLLARPAQSLEQKSQVLFELANDYFKAGLLDRAENLLKEASASSVVRESAFRLLIQIYESEKEWANAIEAVLALASLSGEDLSHSTAQYHCELADRAIAEGDLDSAERSVSEALRYRPRFARATILQGRLRAAGGHHAKAIGIWTDLLNASPEFAHEVVKLVKHSAESLGEAHRYSAFLQRA
ncbi:MAG: tetratricopeptide repeat protein, partial [Arenicellales bacterium]